MPELPDKYRALSIEKKVGQMFMMGLPGEDLDESTYGLLVSLSPGGICLFARNTRNAVKTRMLLDSVRDALLFEPFLALDQEGGLVDRLRRILEPMPSARDVSLSGDPTKIADLARITAEAIRILGFNMNFAPVVDVVTPDREKFTNGLHSRAFGHSAEDVVSMTRTYLKVLEDGGALGCLKHFPGIGAAEVDAHEELPSVGLGPDEFESVDLEPYREHFRDGDALAVMVGHAAYPNLDVQDTDGDGTLLPATLNPSVVTGLLRDKLGFKGIALTDDMEMGAIVRNYGIGEACVLAVEAGNDLVLICNSIDSVEVGYRAVVQAVMTGRISESRLDVSLERIYQARAMLSLPLAFDVTRLEALSKEVEALKNSI
jgi:beta-N-acetylhexosaminidase